MNSLSATGRQRVMHHLMKISLAGSQIVLCGVRIAILKTWCQKLRAFAPTFSSSVVGMSPAYRRAARGLADKCWRVMAMDGCWLATLKQRIGAWTAPYFLHPLADAVWLPGERQAAFARKLGFRQQVIVRGLYACDQPVVEVAHTTRISEGRPVPHSFLFSVGLFPRNALIRSQMHTSLSRNQSRAMATSVLRNWTASVQPREQDWNSRRRVRSAG